MKFAFAWSIAAVALASCGPFPADPRGTLERVRSERSYRVGLIAPADRSMPEAGRLLRRVSAATGASPRVQTGDAEPLLKRLEEGELDLVVGRFDAKSPWKLQVSFGPALRREKQGKTRLQLLPAMRNGENAWISLVERAARDARESGR